MKSAAKKFITAMIFGTFILNAGFSSAQDNKVIFYQQKAEVQPQPDNKNSDRKKEFWDKFRQSVTPREEKPSQEGNKPR